MINFKHVALALTVILVGLMLLFLLRDIVAFSAASAVSESHTNEVNTSTSDDYYTSVSSYYASISSYSK